MIGMFNPVWDDNSGSDAAFLEAVAVAGRILEHKWERFRADERAEQQFAALLAEHRKADRSGEKGRTMMKDSDSVGIFSMSETAFRD